MLIAIYVVIAAFLCLMAIGDWKKWWWVCVIAMIAAGFCATLFPATSNQGICDEFRTGRASHVPEDNEYGNGCPGGPSTEGQNVAIITEDKISAIYQKVVEDPKGGISMTMLIVGLVLGFGICVGFGFIKGGYRLVPRKGGGFIAERVPSLSVKVVRNNLDDEKE